MCIAAYLTSINQNEKTFPARQQKQKQKKTTDIVKIISGLRTNIQNVNVPRPFEKGKDGDSFFCDIVGKT